MAAKTTIYPKSVAIGGGATYTSLNGGPIIVEFSYGGRELNDWTGDAVYPTFTAAVDCTCRCSITIREVKTIIAPNFKGAITITISPKAGGADVIIILASMVFIGAEPATQPRAAPGSITLHFGHESDDGTTGPVS